MNSERVAVTASIGAGASVQFGAALGATLFPVLGPAGVVALRQAFAAAALLAIARPPLTRLTRRQLAPALLLGGVLVVMNLSLYASVERVGLGLAVTLEFLGPLGVALAASRRPRDAGIALVAASGVVLLTGTVPGIDPVGIALGLLAGAAWAAYILLNQQLGRRLPGLQGTAIASATAAVVTAPLLLIAILQLEPARLPLVLALGLAVGLLSSAVPYSIDLAVLRVLRRELFSVLQSMHPAAAVLAGLLLLGQPLSPLQLAGIALVSLGNVAAILLRERDAARERRRQADARDSATSEVHSAST